MKAQIPCHFPQFIWKFWLSETGPSDLPRDSRVHIYDVYDNELSEIIEPPVKTRTVFQDFGLDLSAQPLIEIAEHAFYDLEFKAEAIVLDLMEFTYASGNPTMTNSFSFDRTRLAILRKYLVFLRFRNSTKYRDILHSLSNSAEGDSQGVASSVYFPILNIYRMRVALRAIIDFLQHPPDDDPPRNIRDPELGPTKRADAFQTAMDKYCWRLYNAELCIGVALEDQEFMLSDACFGTLDEGFNEDPESCDLFFPVFPTFALYILGDIDADTHGLIDTPTAKVEVGVESASDVHLRNSMILQTYPRHLYFSSLRPVALSISSYDEFRWTQEHQDYSRLKQRCRQKFLQETVTKTLVVKGSVILTDLTDDITQIGSSAICHGSFSDVWKAVWNDPIEKRSRNVALKVLRKVMVRNTREKLMKRLQAEVIAWHKLCHRNVSQLFGVVQFQNSIGMVSPWCENGTICHYLKGNTTANRLDLLIQIASGIEYLHSAKPVVVHGDLKGGNILIDEHGRPIITDFGLSKVMEDMSESINIGSSFFAGSTRWMAPELILALVEDDGHVPPITTYSDVYAFASVCLEVATGQLPYPNRTNDHAVTVDLLRGIKPSRSDRCYIRLNDENEFWDMLNQCWNQACYLRPTMSELVQRLESLAPKSSSI